MRQAGFTEEEFRKLAKAKANSDGLTVAEFEAMKLVEVTGPQAETSHARARAMMFDRAYHRAKFEIMAPIRDFLVLADARTLKGVRGAQASASVLRFIFIASCLVLALVLWNSYVALNDTLGGSVDEVVAQITRIGGGDFEAPIVVKRGLSESVMGRLSQTQGRLIERDRQRDLAEERVRNSEASLSAVLDQSPLATWIADPQGTLLQLNHACCALLEIKAEEVVGKYNILKDSVVADQGFLPLVRSVFEQGETARFEIVYDSSKVKGLSLEHSVTLILFVTIFPVRDSHGRITHAVIQHLDVTERRRAEERLRASEEDFRAMFELAAVGMAQADPSDGRLLRVNQKLAAFAGYPMGEMIGKRWPEITHPDDRERDWSHFQTLLRGEVPDYQLEKRYLRKDGSIAWGSANVTLTRDADGRPVRTMAAIEDITARKLAETEFRAVIQTSLDGFWINDLSGRLLDANESFCRMLGYSREELLQLSIQDIEASETPARTAAHIRDVMQGGTDRFETRHRRKDGTLLDAEISAQYPSRTGGRLFVFVRDITERLRAEETLRASEARYRTLVESIPEMIFMKDLNSRYVSINQKFALDLGLDPESVVGRFDSDLFSARLAAKYRADDRRVVESGMAEETEEKYVRGERETWVDIIKAPVREKSGEIIGVLGIFRDITARRRAEERVRQLTVELEQRVIERTSELEAANKELEAFSYSVSHDLRAPLRAIDGFGRILLEDHQKGLGPEGRRLLGVISGETRRMGQLVDDLLAFSRLGRQRLEASDVNMTALAEVVFAEQSKLVSPREIRLDLGPLSPARGDRAMLRVALTNLVSNAIKFTAARNPAVIEISSRPEGDRTVYSVKDNGVGFDMTYAHKLFGVFQRLHSAEEFEGTGVGLALTQRVIQRHGGRVWAEGKVGEGATFEFSLPNREEEEP
jgi:PAS domain S-box-containing protein